MTRVFMSRTQLGGICQYQQSNDAWLPNLRTYVEEEGGKYAIEVASQRRFIEQAKHQHALHRSDNCPTLRGPLGEAVLCHCLYHCSFRLDKVGDEIIPIRLSQRGIFAGRLN